MSIIAVVSGLYCSGDAISKQVSDRLGYTLESESFIQEAAREFDTTPTKLTRAMTGDRALFNVVTREYEKSVAYLKAAMAEMLARDDIVYHGPATYLIPPMIDHVLKVGIIADDAYRIRQAAESGVDAKEAEKRIRNNDEELAAWTDQQWSRTPWDPFLFDVKIPLPSMALDEAVDLICNSVSSEALEATARSVMTVEDLQLAARIHLALLERGYFHCNVKASAGKVAVEMTRKPAPPGALGRTVDALRLENLEDEARQICKDMKGVKTLEIRPSGRYPKTLLVDDEQAFVMTLSERLQMRDIDSEVVFNGDQALDFVKSEEPEVMVLDLRMPGIDGIEVLRQVKKHHPNVEVIVITGHGGDEDERIARQLGAFDYLLKPVDIKMLAERIKAASQKAKHPGKKDDTGQTTEKEPSIDSEPEDP